MLKGYYKQSAKLHNLFENRTCVLVKELCASTYKVCTDTNYFCCLIQGNI